jgi:hypothetical protein
MIDTSDKGLSERPLDDKELHKLGSNPAAKAIKKAKADKDAE